jgi:hypothetical protein
LGAGGWQCGRWNSAVRIAGPADRGLTTSGRTFNCERVKNITLSVDDDLYERSRVLAAQRKTTVTALVRDYLRHLAGHEERREQSRREIRAMIGSFGGKVGRMPSREERNARR